MNQTKIEIPSFLKTGFKFHSKWFQGIVEVLEINETKNELKVVINRGEGSAWEEDWNLQHTIWGFEKGDYFAKK